MTREEIRRAARKLGERGLRGSCVATFNAVASRLGKNGEPCSAAVATLAAETGYSERAVQRALGRLVDEGILTASLVPGRTTQYALLTDDGGVTLTPRQNVGGVMVTPEGVEPEGRPTDALKGVGNGTLLFEPGEARERPREPARVRLPPNAALFEALVLAAGWDITRLTKIQRGQAARYAKELAAVGATPAEVAANAARLERQWSQKPAPATLAKHWAPDAPTPTGAASRFLEAHRGS